MYLCVFFSYSIHSTNSQFETLISSDTEIHDVFLLQKKSLFNDISVFPFIVIYLFYLGHIWKMALYKLNHIHYKPPNEYFWIILIIVISINLFLNLLAVWSIEIALVIKFQKIQDIHHATDIYVIPKENLGAPGIFPIEKQQKSFYFQFLYYIFDETLQKFILPKYPENLTYNDYLLCQGISDNKRASLAKTFGQNSLHIPSPTTWMVLKDYLLQPTFTLQVALYTLQIIDGQIYFTIFELLVLAIAQIYSVIDVI